ncbi:Na+/H+ antiporter NhaC [Acidaminobacter sp. JC074]|nr:Na+/H+ antiporter NhaC [Acidaminobacter sp. JC074]
MNLLKGGIILNQNQKKQATLWHALVPIIFLMVTLTYVIRNDGEVHIPLFLSAIVAAVFAMVVLKFSWVELEEGIVDVIKMSMGAIIILMIIGMVVGTWIASGIVPTMIYYGLKVLSPSIFLVATLIMCSIVSLATGSSWTTAATVGVALMGVGVGLDMNPAVVAGAIISGAYFGDKMSPLSDTTNLAPAVSGATLFDHIKHMIYTTGPSYVIALIVFGIMGLSASGNADTHSINEMLTVLEANFSINPLLLLIPVIVIGAVVMKVPAIPGLFGGALLGGLAMIFFQDGYNLLSMFDVMQNGVSYATGSDVIDSLLSRGGLQSMMWTISLILCALTFGGVMEKTGMLRALADGILSLLKGRGGLVLSTVLTAVFMNLVAGDQYLAIVIPGRMYKESYDKLGLHPKNLSRALEDSATLTSPLIPWNTCGAYMYGSLGLESLGVGIFGYQIYCILNLINPILSVIYGYTGFSMHKAEATEEAA